MSSFPRFFEKVFPSHVKTNIQIGPDVLVHNQDTSTEMLPNMNIERLIFIFIGCCRVMDRHLT